MESSKPELLRLPSGPAPVRWRRSRQARRISLRIDPADGAVVVTLPLRAGHQAAMGLLHDNAEWIAARLAALPLRLPFADGALVPIDGEMHRIHHVPAGRAGVQLRERTLQVSGEATFLSRRVGDFLRGEARHRFTTLAMAKAEATGLRPRRIAVKDTRTRWGSCSARGDLAFCWRLVMAPPFVQDYVAAHEVAHLRHMNHGSRFWALVATMTPHTDRAMRWLHDEGPRLLRVG
ncbi:MAG: M48 family metallopeptidase [Rhodospirillales bacterium]|nr:M48 family metallopeptidase [Rhodospirillales bacterium]